MAHHADASSESRWLELVRRWQRSQLSVRAFCQRHHLSEPSFYAWRRVLRQRGLLQEPPPSKPAFVKVALDGQPTPAAIEVVLGHGRLLRLRAGFDADLLRQLLCVLEEPAC
jgi:transposase-like protein